MNRAILLILLASCASSPSAVVPEFITVPFQHECGLQDTVQIVPLPDEPVEIAPGIFTYEGFFTAEFEQGLLLTIAEVLPCAYDVVVIPAALPSGLWGTTSWDEENERFTILLSGFTPPILVPELLAHEWAHALVWDVPGNAHSGSWGVIYAAGYRILVDSGEPEPDEPEESPPEEGREEEMRYVIQITMEPESIGEEIPCLHR